MMTAEIKPNKAGMALVGKKALTRQKAMLALDAIDIDLAGLAAADLAATRQIITRLMRRQAKIIKFVMMLADG